MGRGKQSTIGQAQRRQAIVDYIEKNGPVKSGAICAALSLSRSSLSDDIRAINAHGTILTSPRRGYYHYAPEAGAILPEGILRGKLDRTHIRRWYILALLSGAPHTFEDILSKLQKASVPCSAATLHADLKELRNDTYVHVSIESGRTLYHSTQILAADSREITNYCALHKKGPALSQILRNTYDSIDRKLAHCLPAKDVKIKVSAVRRIGKQNTISEEQLKHLQKFRNFPFADRVLNIPYRSNSGQFLSCSFSTGLIVYSGETGRIYLLGRDAEKRNTVIPLDHIRTDGISVKKGSYNYIYQHPEFMRMFEEMFHLSTDDPVFVRVRFANLPFVHAKIRRLCEMRPRASMKLISDGTEILYTDTLRGLTDFARYLRRFGRSALVDEPAELRDLMIMSSRKILELYDESLS